MPHDAQRFRSLSVQNQFETLDAADRACIGSVLQRIADYHDLRQRGDDAKASRMYSGLHEEVKKLAEDYGDSSGAIAGGAAAGAAAGFLVFGPVGAAIGGLIGGAVGSDAKAETRKKLLEVVDNLRWELDHVPELPQKAAAAPPAAAPPEQPPPPPLPWPEPARLRAPALTPVAPASADYWQEAVARKTPANSAPVAPYRQANLPNNDSRTRVLSAPSVPRDNRTRVLDTNSFGVRAILTITGGLHRGTVITFLPGHVATLGRLEDNIIALPSDTSVSGRHAELTLKDRDFFVRDLNSTNGTHLDGQRITPSTWFPIRSGTEFRVGESTFHLVIEG